MYTAVCSGCAANTFSLSPSSPNAFPAGLSIDASGKIIGTPTTPTTGGPVTVTVRATSSGATDSGDGEVSKDLSIQVVGITSSSTPPAIPQDLVASTSYQITSYPSGGTSFTLDSNPSGPLPSWISVNSVTGLITINPTTGGTFQFTMGTTTGAPATVVTQALTITVTAATAPVITSNLPASPTVAGTVGTSINGSLFMIVASTPPALDANSYTLVGQVTPAATAGLSVNPATGAIIGTPNTSGDFPLTLGATNAGGAGIGTLNRTIRINPSTAPTVTSVDPPASNVNAVFLGPNGYQIVASNGPITSYAEVPVSPSVLQAHGLSLDTGTGRITGTPTASGVFTASVTASNLIGASAPKLLNFTISPTAIPVISSPTFISVAAGTLITPIQVVASNPLVDAYGANVLSPVAVAGMPPGLSVHPGTGLITGTPTTPGNYSVSLTAHNSFGTGNLTIPITIGVPAPSACAMSVPLNTATTLDLSTCLFAGFAPTGVSIVATPSHGTAAASGTRVTYTPVNNYFGADSFSFVGSGTGGVSPQGTVTVTVTGRPDPTKDAVVTAILAAQAETAQRFARAQISNFQRRMESLHGNGSDGDQAGASLQGRSPVGQASGFAAAAALSAPAPADLVPAMAAMGSAATVRPAGGVPGPQSAETVFRTERRPLEMREADALEAVAGGLGLKSLPFAESIFSLVKSRSVNLAGVASGMGLNAPGGKGNIGGMSYWVEGVASFGTRDASGAMSGSEFSSNGVTIGADKRLSDQLAVGMGLGYARDTATIGTDGSNNRSNNRSRGYSLAAYGSYQPSPNTFVDAMLGIGSLDFDSKRYVAPINDFAYGRRGGTQVFGSLTGGYEFRDQALLVSPYGRLDFSYDRLRSSTETGAGAYALTYFGQTSTSVQGALGVRAETVQSTRFGYAVPRLRAEYRHEFQGNGQAFIGYADQPGGPRYALSPSGSGRDSVVFGLGSDFLMRDGLTLSLEYQLSHSFSNDSSYALRLRLTKEFDARGMPKLLETATVRTGKPIDVQVDGSYTTDDNVTRAKAGPDKLSDDFYTVNASKLFVSPLSDQSRLLWTGTLGGDKFHHFNGLSRLLGSVEGEYQYRESSEFDEPTYGAFAKLTAENYETRLRDGYRLGIGVSVRQALTDRIDLFAALSHNRRYANSDVFTTRDNSVRANIDYALGEGQTLYLGGEYRRGDIVSTGRASLENVTVAKVFVQDDAYAGGQFFSYRFNGSTVLTTLGYNLALGPRDSLDFSWRFVRSTPGLRPSFVTSPRSYKANQLSAVYLMRF